MYPIGVVSVPACCLQFPDRHCPHQPSDDHALAEIWDQALLLPDLPQGERHPATPDGNLGREKGFVGSRDVAFP